MSGSSLRRRSMLILMPVAAADVLVACKGSDSSTPGGSGSGTGGAGGSGEPSPSTSGGDETNSVSWTADFWSKEVRISVGPAVRGDSYTVVPVSLSMTDGSEVRFTTNPMSGAVQDPQTMTGARLLDLESGQVYGEVDKSMPSVFGPTVTLHPLFGKLDTSVSRVALLVPAMGIALNVPVVNEGDAAAGSIDVKAIASEADVDDSLAGPFAIGWQTIATDGSSDTGQDDTSVTVNVSGDVTFETDSATLSAQADTVLGTVVDQLRRYPSGGTLEIVGHTDDVADDAYNQSLSEQRAQAVFDRLAALTDLSAWSVSASGKGETEPRVEGSDDEARAANRRVEITATPTKPEEGREGAGGSQGAAGAAPEPAGPVGTGKDGIDVADTGTQGVTLHLSLPEVKRAGRYLVGSLKVGVSGGDIRASWQRFGLPHPWVDRWGASWANAGVAGVTVLNGAERVCPVDFDREDDGEWTPMTSPLPTAGDGSTITVPVVWPDNGQETVTVDLPGGSYNHNPLLGGRLTDIPVTKA